MTILDSRWLPPATMKRVIVHWTAGGYDASVLDKAHYHFLIDGTGMPHRGAFSVKANEAPIRGPYAAHTRGTNTGSIGIAVCCMRGAVEAPWNPGPSPMRRLQWDMLTSAVAQLCGHYGIAVTPKTVLTHAEVQSTLGIKQRGKWDITRLPFDPSVIGARAVGDLLRATVNRKL